MPFSDIFESSHAVITIVHMHKSGVIFIFFKSFQTKKIEDLRPKNKIKDLRNGMKMTKKLQGGSIPLDLTERKFDYQLEKA